VRTDTPWVARRPAKCQRFMPPQSPCRSRAGDVDELADREMIGRDLGATDQRVVGDAELGELALGLDLGDREIAALRLRHVVDLAGTRASCSAT